MNQFGSKLKQKPKYFLLEFFTVRLRQTPSFFNCLNLNIEKVFEISKNLILVGDLNEDLLNPNYHNLKDLILDTYMKNVITEPTRQHAILDLIYYS